MFKSVEYAGFDGRPELRALAERATPILADEVRTFRDQVEVEWDAHPAPPAVELTLTLTLPAGTARAGRLLAPADFADEQELRSRCRGVWGRVLDAYLDKRREAWDEMLRQPAEA